jgi:hypothetical protein
MENGIDQETYFGFLAVVGLTSKAASDPEGIAPSPLVRAADTFLTPWQCELQG